MRTGIIGLTPHAVLGVGLVVWTVVFVRLARRLWFTGDDFDFLLHRSLSLTGEHGLLVPHNEHWSTLPILAFRINYAIFGLHDYLPYAMLPIGCHILVCLLLFALLRLTGVTPWSAVLTSLVAVFTIGAAGAENTLWDFQVGFLGSCVFGLLALTLFASGRWGRVGASAGVAALVLSLMSSGMGLVMVLWCGVFQWMRHGLKAAVASVALPAVVYIGWYAAYGRGHAGAPPARPTIAPMAAMHGLGHIWSSATAIPNSGPAVLLALVAVVALPGLAEPLFTLAASGLVAVVGAYLLLGYSRSAFGIDATLRSRYVYFGLVFTIPAVAVGVQVVARSLRSRPARVAVIVWLTAGSVVFALGIAQAARSAKIERGVVANNRARIVAAAQLVESSAPLLRSRPMPARNPDVDVASLRKRSVRAALPEGEPGPLARLDVAANLQVDVSPAAHSLAPAADVRWVGFGPPHRNQSDASAGASCETRATVVARPVIEVPLKGIGVEFRMSVNGKEIATQLVADGHASEVVRWTTHRAVSMYVASTAAASTLRIQVPPGPVTVCRE